MRDEHGNILLTMDGEQVGLRFSYWSLELAAMAAGSSVHDLVSGLQVIPTAFRSITYLVYGAYKAWCEQYGHPVEYSVTHVAHALESNVEYTLSIVQSFCDCFMQLSASKYFINPN